MTRRILVVEDQQDNRQILRDLLGSAGYELIEVEDGEAAIAAAKGKTRAMPTAIGGGRSHGSVDSPGLDQPDCQLVFD